MKSIMALMLHLFSSSVQFYQEIGDNYQLSEKSSGKWMDIYAWFFWILGLVYNLLQKLMGKTKPIQLLVDNICSIDFVSLKFCL